MISPCSLGKRQAELDEAQADPHETEDDAGQRHLSRWCAVIALPPSWELRNGA
jgi:hypothetical protein